MAKRNERLRMARKAKNLTQFQVAQLVSINPQYYSMIERGVRTPGFRLAKRLSDVIGEPIDQLFFGQDQNELFADEQAVPRSGQTA